MIQITTNFCTKTYGEYYFNYIQKEDLCTQTPIIDQRWAKEQTHGTTLTRWVVRSIFLSFDT